MAPQPVWLQLCLFHDCRHASACPEARTFASVNDQERDRRSGGQWLRSIRAYLNFRAGCSWRRLGSPQDRNSPEYSWYIGGIRTLNGIEAGANQPHPMRVVNRPSASSPLCTQSRESLVATLMAHRPDLTDKKILSHLPRPKLARMVEEAFQRVEKSA